MTFEQRIADLNADGWLVNNLFQLDGGKWRASVRRPGSEIASAFAAGDTPVEAIDRAMKTVVDEIPAVAPRPAELIEVAPPPSEGASATIEDLLG